MSGICRYTLLAAAVVSLAGTTAHAWVSIPAEQEGQNRSIALFANGDLVTTSAYRRFYPDVDMAVVRVDGLTGDVVWLRDLSTSAADETSQVAVDFAGDVVTVNLGTATVIKLDGSTGEVRWQTPLSGSARTFAVDPTGDVVVGGTIGLPPDDDEIVTKVSGASGAVLWTQVLPATTVATVTIDGHGDILLSSIDRREGYWFTSVLRRLAGADGSPLWENRLPISFHEEERPVAAMLHGGGEFVVALHHAFRNDEGLRPGATPSNWWSVVSADTTSGTVLWRTDIAGPANGPYINRPAGLATAADGTIYACGVLSTPSGASNVGFAVVALDGSGGAERWRYLLNGGGIYSSAANGVAVAPDGSVVATGRTSKKGANNMYATSLRPHDGHPNWGTAINLTRNPPSGEGTALVVDPSGAIGIAGSLYEPFASAFPAVVKLAPNGTSFGVLSLGITPRPVRVEVRESF